MFIFLCLEKEEKEERGGGTGLEVGFVKEQGGLFFG